MKPQNFSEFLIAWLDRVEAGTSYSVGSAFLDELYACGKHTLANSFVYSKHDPFGKDIVTWEAIAFVHRCW